jgi:hypothetical protein
MGDFNDFARSPVMEAMTAEGSLVNVFMDGPAALPPQEQYTYIFSGYAQLIDGILVSESLANRALETMIMHANADYPYVLGLDTSAAGLPFHFSDHDVPLLLLDIHVESSPPTSQPLPTLTTTTEPPSPSPMQTPIPEHNLESELDLRLPIFALLLSAAVFVLALFTIRTRRKK